MPYLKPKTGQILSNLQPKQRLNFGNQVNVEPGQLELFVWHVTNNLEHGTIHWFELLDGFEPTVW